MKGDKIGLVRDFLKDNPTLASRTIARILFEKYPNIFPTIENARSRIRHARGDMGVKNRQSLHNDPLDFDQRNADYKVPKSHNRDYSPFVVTGVSKVGILNDIHMPYHDQDALSCALEWHDREEVDCLILNGDIGDFYQVSNFNRDPSLAAVKDEVDMLKEFLGNLRKMFPEKRIIYKFGNHEERFSNFIFQKAPELYGFSEMTLEHLLHLEDMQIELVKDKRVIKLGHLSVIHGHELKGGMVSPVSPARTFVLRTKTNTLGAHHHQTSEQNDRKLSGDLLSGFSVGCLCSLFPHYMPINNHNHGTAQVDLDGDNFYVKNRRILAGRLL